MHRRSLFPLLAVVALTACRQRPSGSAVAPSTSPAPRAAVAEDYRWFSANADLAKGFSFVWVKTLSSKEVMDRLGATELERIYWRQLVGSGDGERGYPDRRFFGVARVDDWVLVVEDNGTLGIAENLLRPLSEGTTVISHYRAPTGQGRLLMFTDGVVDLDFDPLTGTPRPAGRTSELASLISAVGFGASTDPAHCTAAAFALTERLTGIAMTQDLLETKTYLLSSAPRG